MTRRATVRYEGSRLNDQPHDLRRSNLLLLVLMVLIIVVLAVANFDADLPNGEPITGWVQP